MHLSLQLLAIFAVSRSGESFVHQQSVLRTPSHHPSSINEKHHQEYSCQSSSFRLYYSHHSDRTPEEMRLEIESMKQEALHKIEVLQERIRQAEEEREEDRGEDASTTLLEREVERNADELSSSVATALDPKPSSSHGSFLPQQSEEELLDFMARERDALEQTNRLHSQPSHTTNTETSQNTAAVDKPQEALRRLDDTRWRMMLNIGRAPGTWMPKEWGASGECLHLQLELEFASDPLLETENGDFGDAFLNGRSNVKIVKVVHNEASMSPTLTEGVRKVRVRNGAWRVVPHEGPMGTSVLRFYIELEEQASHHDSDIWCPAGRVYCTCGYFPMYHDPIHGFISTSPNRASPSTSNISPVSLKDALKEEQEFIAAQYEVLARDNANDPAILSWDKLKRASKMTKLKQQATKLAHKRHELHIREPDKSVLRLSQDQTVGVTKEGGVCCKVHKGLAMEYHMLGKFEIASMQNRDHKDYRDLLP